MELIAKKRTELGKKSKKIRRTGNLAAVMFGKGLDSVPLTIDYNRFTKVYKDTGESTLIDLKIDNEPATKVLISSVTYDPVTSQFSHANFHKVNLKEKISATVPIEIVGESPIVKAGEGLLLILINEVTVEALPSDLPHDIKVDISGLTALEQGIFIKDLAIDHTKIEVVSQDADELVVKIDYAEMKEEEAPLVEVTEEELVAKVAATAQLTEEEKAEKEKADKEKKEKDKKE